MDDILSLILQRLNELDKATNDNARERHAEIAALHTKIDGVKSDVATVRTDLATLTVCVESRQEVGKGQICQVHQADLVALSAKVESLQTWKVKTVAVIGVLMVVAGYVIPALLNHFLAHVIKKP